MNNFDAIKERVQNKIDEGISEVPIFLRSNKEYYIRLRPDPLETDKIWFIELGVKYLTPKFILACVLDAKKEIADDILFRYVLLLQSMGYSIVKEDESEFEFDHSDLETMKEFAEFFSSNSEISINNEYKNDSCSIICTGDDSSIGIIDTDGLSIRSAWIITKQLIMLIAGFGKNIEIPYDKTSGNQYGIVDFLPDITNESFADE